MDSYLNLVELLFKIFHSLFDFVALVFDLIRDFFWIEVFKLVNMYFNFMKLNFTMSKFRLKNFVEICNMRVKISYTYYFIKILF